MPERSVTIVHLSDIQFGKFHRFPDAAEPSNAFDTLSQRLIADLEYLRREHKVEPDIILVTGDLAEWGRRSELHQVFTFLGQAAEALRLPRSRVAIIPGNHDVDRKACAAYFLDCESREIPHVRPYPAKWTHFKAFFEDFYRDAQNVSFTDAEPWTLFEYPELFTVIAGLNSTWADSHLEADHYGYVGEEQMRWFESRLRTRKQDGWLRIAALHHNVRPGPTSSEESLRDAPLLRTIMGPLVNAVVHGHTHDGQTDVFRPNVPIYSTGSASVAASERPPEVPNQYQVLQFTARGASRWARAYRADERKFIGDNRATEHGDDWRTSDTFDWPELTAFRTGVATDRPERGAQWETLDQADDLLTRIEHVCRVRHPSEAKTQQVRSPIDPLPYLHLTIHEGAVTTQYPIAAAEHPLTSDVLAAFAGTVHARYSRYDKTVPSLIVYAGAEAPGEDLQRQAGRLGITLQSWLEFQGLIDFGPYVEAQRKLLENDPRYQPHLYVPQRIRYTTPAGDFEHDDALEYMVDLMAEPEGRFVVILGEFGTGKSFLQRQLALRLSDMPRPQPILIEMRTLEKANDIDQLIAQHLVRHFPSFNLRAVRYMLKHGRLALLFDGFDELAMRVSYDHAAEHLQTLVQASEGQAKIVVTSRTEYFESDQQVRSALAERIEAVGGRRIVRLLRFDRPRILRFLMQQLGDTKAAELRMTLLDDIKDLSGLSENARMLSFISTLDENELREAKTREGKVTRSSVYRTLVVDKWLTFETDRLAPRGAAPPLSVQERWGAVMVLARHMWAKPNAAVKLTELSERIADTVGKLPRIEATAATHQVGSGTLLVRDAEGNFSFVHRSILEWLVATDAAAEIREGRTPNAMMVKDISPLIADFIEEEVDAEVLLPWVRRAMTGETADSTLRRNAAMLFARQSGAAQEAVAQEQALELSDTDLRGRDFSGVFMPESRLVGANLAEARFRNTNLVAADLRRANLRHADLTSALAVDANFRDADLSHARLRGANLRGAVLAGADLYRADLVRADVDEMALSQARTLGAALPFSPRPQPLFDDIAWGPLTFSPGGDLLAVMGPHSIRVLDTSNGRQLAPYSGSPTSRFTRVAWSLDGAALVAGTNEGEVFFWDVSSSAPRWHVKVDKSGVLALALLSDTIVCVTRTGLLKLDRKGRGSGLPVVLPTSAIAADIDARGGSVLVVLTDGRTGEIDGGEFKVWRKPATSVDESRVAVSAEGRRIVYAVGKTAVVLTPEEMRRVDIKVDAPYIAVSPGGTHAAIADFRHLLILSTDDASIADLNIEVRFVAFHPAGDRLAYIHRHGWFAMMAWTTGTEMSRARGSVDAIFAIGMPADGMVQVLNRGTIARFDIESGARVSETANPSSDVTYPWGNAALFKGAETTVLSYDLTQSRILALPEPSIAAIATDRTVAYAGGDVIRMISRTGARRTVSVGGARLLQFTPNGKMLVGCDDQDRLFVAAVSTGRILRVQNIWSRVKRIAVSSHGEIAVLASKVTILKIGDLSPVDKLPFSDAASAAYSASGSLLAIGRDGALTVRDESGTLRHVVSPREYAHVIFSPSERSVACASYGGVVDVYDTASLALVASLGIADDGWTIFRPDGRFKSSGDLQGRFGHAIGLVRYEPGELDSWLDTPLRVPENQPLIES